ncbi:diacylglycerol kinase family protein [Candidatus Dojkabacteria bacterium]|nr:diacylglycerol kinase family protein [Candidatus Dojkabacteria bacterium]
METKHKETIVNVDINGKNTAFIPIRFDLSLRHAFQGLMLIVKNERNFRIQLGFTLCVIILGLIFKVTRPDWIAIFIVVSLVLVSESFNSVVEAMCDVIYQKYNERVKYAKDVSAGAVLVSTIIAIVTGTVVFFPYFVDLVVNLLNL